MGDGGFIERVDFVTIATRDAQRAKAFYNGVLGLPSRPGSSDEFETANVTLGLWCPGGLR